MDFQKDQIKTYQMIRQILFLSSCWPTGQVRTGAVPSCLKCGTAGGTAGGWCGCADDGLTVVLVVLLLVLGVDVVVGSPSAAKYITDERATRKRKRYILSGRSYRAESWPSPPILQTICCKEEKKKISRRLNSAHARIKSCRLFTRLRNNRPTKW